MGRLKKSEQEKIFIEDELAYMGPGELPDRRKKNGK